jgi:hypothetical protein
MEIPKGSFKQYTSKNASLSFGVHAVFLLAARSGIPLGFPPIWESRIETDSNT